MSYTLSNIQENPIIEIDQFLTESECDTLLDSRIQQFEKANSHYPEYYRNNDRYVEDTPTLANQLFIKLKKMNLQTENILLEMICLNKRIRFCRYQKGQSFSVHKDGVYYLNDVQASRYTFLIYLNENFHGGLTEFYINKSDVIPVKICTPKKGKLIVFDHDIWHRGSIVTKGNKYILRSDIIINKPIQNNHHNGYIWSLKQVNSTTFISCGRDTYIKIWNTRLKLINTIKIHSKSVIKIIRIDQDHFLSCSRDFTLKKWTIDGNVISSIRFSQMIISLHKNLDNTLLAAGTSGTIYHLSNKLTIIDRIEVHTNWIWDLIVLPNKRIISCSEDGSIHCTNLISKKSICMYRHTTPLFCMHLDKKILYIGTKDGVIIQMCLISKSIQFHQIHQDAIRAIKIHNEMLITCGEDNIVVATSLKSKKSQELLKTNNYIQDILIIKNTIYVAGFDGFINTIKL